MENEKRNLLPHGNASLPGVGRRREGEKIFSNVYFLG